MNNRFYKNGLTVVLIIALIIMAFLGIKLSSRETDIKCKNYDFEDNNYLVDENQVTDSINTNVIFVDIDGAVKNPGVYKLNEGDRVNDAILLAGGLTDDAYTRNLNKARKVIDGEKIYIPKNWEVETENIESSNINSNLIDINSASKEKLMTLPGIGEVYAQRIIDYRNNKPFSNIEEIKNIDGIGDKTFEKLKDKISVN